MKMALKDKAKDMTKKKIKKLVFKVIKPFLPFIIVIVGIVLAVCTVVDSLFTTEEDMQVAEQLSSEIMKNNMLNGCKIKKTLLQV